MAKKEKVNINEFDSDNIGKKDKNEVEHISIMQFQDTDEAERRKLNYEKQEKKKRLGIFDKFRLNKDDDDEHAGLETLTTEFIEKNSRSNNVERFNPDINKGLTQEQVDERIKQGLVNDNQKQYSKSYKQIFFQNIFTFFNILCIAVAVALIVVRTYKNLTFLIILSVNTIIGIIQEIRAKKIIDGLSIVKTPTVKVTREGTTRETAVKDIVLDDIIVLQNGNQIAADCEVVDGEIEVNESLITGESVNVKKVKGSRLFAGSFVTSGKCTAKAIRVGNDCYIQKLQSRAKKYTKPKSELSKSMRLITILITLIIIPLGTIMAIINYDSAKSSVLSPTFGTSGSFALYSVNTTTNSENKICKITDYGKILEESNNTISIDTTNIENVSAGNAIKLKYDNKASGNISISQIRLYYAEAHQSEDDPTNIYYTYHDSPDEAWSFNNPEEEDETISKIYGVHRYLDGSLKFDDTGDYVQLSFTNCPTLETSTFRLMITLQSRGYGYDETPEEEIVVSEQTVKLTVTKTAGSLVGMIPAGLFLLVTVALSASVLRLSKRKTLVQELYGIEMLARVDCICLDKTGTITDGTMIVKDIIEIDTSGKESIESIMASYLGASDDNNLTSIALKNKFGATFDAKKVSEVPFSSSRKLGAISFEGKGTYILGAPEFVYTGKSEVVNNIVHKQASMGYRVLMLAKSSKMINGENVPTDAHPIALITLEDHIREEAYDTIKWFKENGVQVKVISGDNPATVAEIAAKVGIDGAQDYISLEGLSTQEVETIAGEYTVYGRVSPDQKAILIRTLRRLGKTVAMTGDGVNDILAMKEADCSIAMASGSDAATNVAQLVLLDSDFSNMPEIVKEGRRVINNIQSSASLYLMKTLFVMVITLFSIFGKNIFKTGYPFEPIQFLLLEMSVIGIPSMVLAIQPNHNQIKGTFLGNIFANCVTQALCLILTVVVIYYYSVKKVEGLDLTNYAEVNSICIMGITYVGFIILCNICRPFNVLRTALCLVIFTIITVAFSIPEIAEGLSLSYMFKDLDITKKLFLLVVILVMIPIETFFNEIINSTKKIKKIEKKD